MVLTDKQRMLVEEHMHLVDCVIRCHITVKNSVNGLEYDDLYQAGCLALCHAATKYDVERGEFKSFAPTVIKNMLISHIRKVIKKEYRLVYEQDSDECTDSFESMFVDARAENQMRDVDVLCFLDQYSKTYTGNARLGIEAIKMKTKGYSTGEIAEHYGVTSNYIAVWINRAAKKLRQERYFIENYAGGF